MQIRAKFQCYSVKRYAGNQASAELTAVAPQNTPLSDEEKAFWEATPNGKLEISVTREAVADFFEPGKKYYLTFEAAAE